MIDPEARGGQDDPETDVVTGGVRGGGLADGGTAAGRVAEGAAAAHHALRPAGGPGGIDPIWSIDSR